MPANLCDRRRPNPAPLHFTGDSICRLLICKCYYRYAHLFKLVTMSAEAPAYSIVHDSAMAMTIVENRLEVYKAAGSIPRPVAR